MGQKVNPYGLRLGIIDDWRTRWFSEKEYAKYLREDIAIRRYLVAKLYHAGLSKIEIERTEQQVTIAIHAGRPGIVIGKKGAEVDKLRKYLEHVTGKRVRIDIQEVTNPEADAALVAQNVAQQLEGRISFRRAMRKAVTAGMNAGAKGIKISCAGRLGGTEMSRSEWYREGRVPLQTLRADIDYGIAEANTKSGKIGVKVWIFRGEVEPRYRGVERAAAEKPAKDLAPAEAKAEAAAATQQKVEEKVKETAAKKPAAKAATGAKPAAAGKPAKKPAKATAAKVTAAKAGKPAAKKPATKPAGKPAAKKPAAKAKEEAKPSAAAKKSKTP